MRVLALSGSLRASSSNASLLRLAASLAPAEMEFFFYQNTSSLPYFSPDLDTEPPPEAVGELRAQISAADRVVISCPEYVHSLPGSFKNLLDWIVSSGEFGGKVVLLLNASPFGGMRAQEQLRHILEVMNALVLDVENILTPAVRAKMGNKGQPTDSALQHAIAESLRLLASTHPPVMPVE